MDGVNSFVSGEERRDRKLTLTQHKIKLPGSCKTLLEVDSVTGCGIPLPGPWETLGRQWGCWKTACSHADSRGWVIFLINPGTCNSARALVPPQVVPRLSHKP